MRYIRLCYNDYELFQMPFTEAEFAFYYTHRDAFKQMIRDQGRDFWIRFLLSFRSFHSYFGFIALMSTKTKNFNEVLDWFFIQLHEQFIDGCMGGAKQLLDDISLAVEKRYLLAQLKSKSYVKDPFYSVETRDIFRRLFGNPSDQCSYLRAVVIFPMYELFAGSLVSCLRRWIDASDQDSEDTSYWVAAPAPRSTDSPSGKSTDATSSNKSSNKSKDSTKSSNKFKNKMGQTAQTSSKTTPCDLSALYERELSEGSPHGPVFVREWPVNRDPRFLEPTNPLYDPAASRDSDWRVGLTVAKYEDFVAYTMLQQQCSDDCHIAQASDGDRKDGDEREAAETRAARQRRKDGERKGVAGEDDSSCTGATNCGQSATGKHGNKQQTTTDRRHTHNKQRNSTTAQQRSGTAQQHSGTAQQRSGTAQQRSRQPGTRNDSGTVQQHHTAAGRQTQTADVQDETMKDAAAGEAVDSGARDARKNILIHSTLRTLHVDTQHPTVSASSSAATAAATVGLRQCAHCRKQELTAREFKKCRRCKEVSATDAKYYCSRDCQVADWTARHCRDHRETVQELKDTQ